MEGEVMRKSVLVMAVVALVMSFAGVSSASAVQWSPQNTNFSGTASGSGVRFEGLPGLTMFNCGTFTLAGKTTGSAITGAAPTVSSCIDGGGSFGYVSAYGTWSLNALSTTSASLSANTSPSGGTVMEVKWGTCVYTAKGPLTITGLQWSNTTHILTIPSGTSIPVSASNPTCASALEGSTVKIKGELGYLKTLTVTP
jgi:hypothetical protein